MAFPISSIPALGARRALGESNLELCQILQRLSSGFPGQDSPDPGNAWLKAIRAATQGRRHAKDGIALLRAVNGTLNEMEMLLSQGSALAQSASATNVPETTRSNQDAALQGILNNLRNLAGHSRFNGEVLFNSVPTRFTLGRDTTLDIVLGQPLLDLSGDIHTVPSANAILQRILEIRAAVAQLRIDLDLKTLQLISTSDAMGVEAENFSAAQNHVQEVNFVHEVVNLAKFQILNHTEGSFSGGPAERVGEMLALL